MHDKAYCVHCRQWEHYKQKGEKEKLKNGAEMTRGNCARCGHKVCLIQSCTCGSR